MAGKEWNFMNKDLKCVLITEDEIRKKVETLAETLNNDYDGKTVMLILVLKGSIVFCADLMRKLKFPVVLEIMKVSSYASGTTSGELRVDLDVLSDVKNKHIIIVEDIIDSGNTLYKLKSMLMQREPASVRICTLLDKPERRQADINADYTGITIPDEFVVGYGLDFNERYRELPYIGVLGEWMYS